MLLHQRVEIQLHLAQSLARQADVVALKGTDLGGDRIETAGRALVAGTEGGDLLVGGLRHEILGNRLHPRQGRLEFPAGIGQHGGALDAFEGVADLGLPGREGHAIGQKTDDRNDRDGGDAAAHREIWDDLRGG